MAMAESGERGGWAEKKRGDGEDKGAGWGEREGWRTHGR